ncbi:vacuolar protein-sorting-associated protein 25-like [Daphnia carinata]|uniref:vacuolar protein-sorting-associated protein 25-like n=1 Tax=Daphnia carinata TaxID=120202 RepID=UPI00257B7B85|nr:vacuolar protein-sorting-associated protein 25-like [Daphnia carinata]
MEFSWPWQYDFPPFFTLQPNLDTQKKQLEAWRKLVIDYCRHNKIFVLDVQESIPLFQNKTIDRQLSSEGIKRVLEILQENNLIEWCDKSKKQCFVYWKTPQEWGNLIYHYITDKGMTNTVCTFYELTEGDDVKNEEFAGLDKSMLLKALRTLEASNKAEVIMFGGSEGVKFF